MINLDGMISISYLKKAVFTGSCGGMRYLIRKQSADDGETLQAVTWPGPFIFSCTPDEKKTFHEFSFNKEGLDEAIGWLNTQYETCYHESGESARKVRETV